MGRIHLLPLTWQWFLTRSECKNSVINPWEVNFRVETCNSTGKMIKKHISEDLVWKTNLTRILWAGRCTTIFTPKIMPFRLIFIYFFTFSGNKGAFNSSEFLFFSPSFLFMGTGVTILVCRHKYKYNSGFGWGCCSSNTPVILEKRFIQGAFNSPIFGHVDISKRIFCPNFKKMQNDRPGSLALTIFLKLVQKWTKKYISWYSRLKNPGLGISIFVFSIQIAIIWYSVKLHLTNI